MADPVGDGLVASLAQPNGNVTGTTFIGPELIAKRLGLLKEAIPGAAHIEGQPPRVRSWTRQASYTCRCA
jgi:ABC-type uncharacterized transport system substrate-binding protein